MLPAPDSTAAAPSETRLSDGEAPPSVRAPRLGILLLCYEYPPLGGGGGVGAQQYAEAWAAAGHRVTVVTGHAPGLPRRVMERGVDVVRVRTPGKAERATATGLSMLMYLVAGAWWILRRRRTLRSVDVLNTHFSLPTGPLGRFAALVLGKPEVLTIIGGDIFDPTKRSSPHRHALLRAVNRFLIDRADRVIAISSDTKRRAQQHYGVARRIDVVNYGFQPPRITEAVRTEARNGRYRLVSVGRLVARKGFADLLDALALLPDDVRLTIVGDGPLASDLARRAEAAGVADRVTWAGYEPRERIYGHLHSADCYVLSSLHEGLGIVVQEAMYAALPVVATDNGGQVDLIEPEANGLLVPVADPVALAAAIERLYRDRKLGRAMGENNGRAIARWFVGENAEEYVTVFREAIAARAVNR